MIPKIIHYCWLSNDPIPTNLQAYIINWQKILPDYEIILWNFDRFNKESSLWVNQAFESKKYAFAADYLRLFALYNYGGIYLDSDVEVIKSFNPLLHLKTMICYEASRDRFEMATFGVEKNADWVRKCLDYYDGRPFIKKDGLLDVKVFPMVINEVFKKNGIVAKDASSLDEALSLEKDGKIPILSYDYFSPKDYATGEINLTDNTFSIHQFAGAWLPKYAKLEHRFWQLLRINDLMILTRFVKYKRLFFLFLKGTSFLPRILVI